ncbi:MAG: carboxypeptidase-like regulatory domain-containing protein [Terriglobales bacterium]
MIRTFFRNLIPALAAAALLPAAWGQMATVKGKVTDEKGQPFAGAVILYHNQENGRKYELKTDKSGDYFSIGVLMGRYRVSLYSTDEQYKEGKETFFLDNVQVLLSP